jgi:BirA family biotin operon repressor/biotin-[acetyl-CoA-carboxylase] ligase
MNSAVINFELVKPGILKRFIFLEETGSTNEYATSHKVQSDTLIISPNQTKGKGRFGRKWISSPGKNISLTLVKDFRIGVDEIHNVGFYTSLTLANSLEKFLPDKGASLSLKWPNDVLLSDKKVGGMLLDCRDLRSAEKKISIGIGVNVNEDKFDDDIKAKATSMFLSTGKEYDIDKIVITFIKEFYSQQELISNPEKLMTLWKMRCNHIGREIYFRILEDGNESKAIVMDIMKDGSIKLLNENGKVTIHYSGEISLAYGK